MSLRSVALAVLLAAVLCVCLAAVVLYLAYRTLRKIKIAANSDFLTTVRAVPLSLVVGLDLLDIGLDVFSTPFTWLILDRLGLKVLRNVATIKALVPVVDMIPLLTLIWFGARLFKLGNPPEPQLDVIETERIGPGRYAPRAEP
jgi:hypothetical protein